MSLHKANDRCKVTLSWTYLSITRKSRAYMTIYEFHRKTIKSVLPKICSIPLTKFTPNL